MNRRRRIAALAAALAILVAVFACGGGSTEDRNATAGSPTGRGPLTIGAIVFLTGPQAALGAEVQNAISLALEEINEGGGIGGQNLDVIYEDSRDQPSVAITAFRRLADRNLPVLLSTGDVVSRTLTPFAVEAGLPLVATVAGGQNIPRAEGVFRVWIRATAQGARIAEYAASDLKLRRVASLRINNEFGEDSFGAFQKTFEAAGGRVVGVETFGVADREVRNQIAKLTALKPDAMFVTGFGDGYGAAIKQLRESGFKGTLLADATLAISFFRQQTAPANEGAYLATTLYDEESQEPKARNYTSRWRAKYKNDPSFVGAFAYDSIGLIAEVLRKGVRTPRQVLDGLRSIETYSGAIGPMRFMDDGELDFPMVIKKIEGGKQIVVDK